MRNGVTLTVGGCLLFVAVVLGGFVYSVTRDTGLTDKQLVERGAVLLPRPRALPPVSLIDASGKPWAPTALAAGRWTLVYFGFTHCPDICPVSLAVLADARKQIINLGDAPFDVTLITVDPERDTPAVLRDYVSWFDPDFRAVTGEHGQIAQLATAVNVAFAKVPGDTPGTYTVDHTGHIVMINPAGHYHGFLKAPHKAAAIAEVVHTLALKWQPPAKPVAQRLDAPPPFRSAADLQRSEAVAYSPPPASGDSRSGCGVRGALGC